MEVLYAICCGLDVHKASVTACLRSPGVGAQRHPEVCRLASIRSTPTEAPSRDVQRPYKIDFSPRTRSVTVSPTDAALEPGGRDGWDRYSTDVAG
jgi:hypothetical protein